MMSAPMRIAGSSMGAAVVGRSQQHFSRTDAGSKIGGAEGVSAAAEKRFREPLPRKWYRLAVRRENDVVPGVGSRGTLGAGKRRGDRRPETK